MYIYIYITRRKSVREGITHSLTLNNVIETYISWWYCTNDEL